MRVEECVEKPRLEKGERAGEQERVRRECDFAHAFWQRFRRLIRDWERGMERSKIKRGREAECSLYWAAPSMAEGRRTNEVDESGAKKSEEI